MRRWPDSLPGPRGDSLAVTERDSVLRTDMESGPRRTRRTSRVRTGSVNATWRLTTPQMATWLAWWGDEVAGLIGPSDGPAAWTATGAVAIDGLASTPHERPAWFLREDSTTGPHRATATAASTPIVETDDDLAFEAMFRPEGRTVVEMAVTGRDGLRRAVRVHLATGAVSGAPAGVTAQTWAGIDDWRLVAMTVPAGDGLAPIVAEIALVDGTLVGGAVSYAGNGSSGVMVATTTLQRARGIPALPVDAKRRVLGAAGGAAWVVMPLDIGDGPLWQEARFEETPSWRRIDAAGTWELTAKLEIVNA